MTSKNNSQGTRIINRNISSMPYHSPVLLQETLEGLEIKPDGTYVDCTFGGGGHSSAILERLNEKGKLFGFDRDLDSAANALNDSRFKYVRGNFKHVSNFLQYYGVEKIDGILADLGVSSHHFDQGQRGFSYRFDGKLDMRMNRLGNLTAEKILNSYEEDRLADIFYYYGEISKARKIASAITKYRQSKKIETIFEFVDILLPFCRKNFENKELAPIFQALRIEVNGELDALKMLLEQIPQILKTDGRAVIISYHSLEDRLVKNFFKTGNFEGMLQKDFYGNPLSPMQAVNNRVVVASENEIAENPRARSAKLRVAKLFKNKKNNIDESINSTKPDKMGF